ncbi:chemotaxis protein CheD [uncultured Deefgea sp.]|uniref:chemotaxis protein CheD n=1 Tax=uncultured Deefgea sp. TaxID=1304914 RepID=UPI002629FFBE|nr:chemotaxis protein CheD [uncultured Deefgea sp.]
MKTTLALQQANTPPVMNEMKQLERHARHIHSGDIAVESHKPIMTLLGSCISVCLFDPQLKIAGMNHFMLPNFGARAGQDVESLHSGMASMELLVNALLKQGAKKGRLQAKAFGGGNLVPSAGKKTIGETNIEFTHQWLDAEGIPLLASDLGGNCARKIVLNPISGEVLCRQIQPQQIQKQQLIQEEESYKTKLMHALNQRKIDYW